VPIKRGSRVVLMVNRYMFQSFERGSICFINDGIFMVFQACGGIHVVHNHFF
jgi:hypothetical protein